MLELCDPQLQLLEVRARDKAQLLEEPIEPGACPAATDNMAPYTKMPIMILWGDYVETSSRWSPPCRATQPSAWP